MCNCLIKSGEGYLIEFDYPRMNSPLLTTNINEATEFIREEAMMVIKRLIKHGWQAYIVTLNNSTTSISVEEAKRKKRELEHTIKRLIDEFEKDTYTTVKMINIDENTQEFGRKRSFFIKIDVNL